MQAEVKRGLMHITHSSTKQYDKIMVNNATKNLLNETPTIPDWIKKTNLLFDLTHHTDDESTIIEPICLMPH
jgi:hypothetical protein